DDRARLEDREPREPPLGTVLALERHAIAGLHAHVLEQRRHRVCGARGLDERESAPPLRAVAQHEIAVPVAGRGELEELWEQANGGGGSRRAGWVLHAENGITAACGRSPGGTSPRAG